jgi:selenocysteine lyase/cysteine desulfurase
LLRQVLIKGGIQMSSLEKYFKRFRKNTVGYDKKFRTCFGKQSMVYADWAASGRLYKPIEDRICSVFGPYVGNTHTEASVTGTTMTKAYNYARKKIKKHVNADENDILIVTGFGMTSAVNKLQRILGLRLPAGMGSSGIFPAHIRPVVFITHMEHHSNYVSWLECDVELVVVPPDPDGLVDLNNLEMLLRKYADRPYKIGAFTACSNVTGIETPYYEMARLMHSFGGVCFIDWCSSAPYTNISMHPKDPMEQIDGLYFSPHKFLGGPGAPGILIFNPMLYRPQPPDNPGGGTVLWTNPWGEYRYLNDVEMREDGGTPGFLQTIKTAMCLELKNKMKVKYMVKREHKLVKTLMSELSKIKRLHILQDNITDRLGIVSFYVDDVHYNLIVKVLNDCYGIQTRGGCTCAGPYGHYLLNIDRELSKFITDELDTGNMSIKPGWVRISIHPMMTNKEIHYIASSVRKVVKNIKYFKKKYKYDSDTNEFIRKRSKEVHRPIKRRFKL